MTIAYSHPMVNKFVVCIDVNDRDLVRPFWREALGYEETTVENGSIILTDPTGVGPVVWFQPVPESKSVKNRVHLDITAGSRAEAADLAARLVALGGSIVNEFDDFIVMADPEGSELCLEFEI